MTVIWITGLPGVGKTAAAQAVAAKLRGRNMPCVVLDGDAMREALSPLGAGYDMDSRRRLAATYSGIARILAEQGVIVIVATVSLFAATHAANRQLFRRYTEVLLNCDETVRNRRRPPSANQWPARDLPIEFPANPHLAIDTTTCAPIDIAERIIGLALDTAAEH